MAHVKDEVYVDGKIEPSRLRSVYRVGTDLYANNGDIWEIKVPDYKFDGSP